LALFSIVPKKKKPENTNTPPSDYSNVNEVFNAIAAP